MFLRHFQNFLIALVGAILPLLIICLVIIAIYCHNQTTNTNNPNRVLTPNPQKALPYFMMWQPGNLLVYLDPWFAGTLFFWLDVWIPILTAFVIAATIWWPFGRLNSGGHRLKLLALISSGLGFVFSLPWWVGLFDYMSQGSR